MREAMKISGQVVSANGKHNTVIFGTLKALNLKTDTGWDDAFAT
jgi:hypothetical protein